MTLTTRDMEILSAAFQCLRDPDAFKVGQLLRTKPHLITSHGLSLFFPKFVFYFEHIPSLCLSLFISNYVFCSEYTHLNPPPRFWSSQFFLRRLTTRSSLHLQASRPPPVRATASFLSRRRSMLVPVPWPMQLQPRKIAKTMLMAMRPVDLIKMRALQHP